MNPDQLKNIVEAALLAAEHPLSLDNLLFLFGEDEAPERKDLREALERLGAECEQRGIELREVASGYRFQVKSELGPWVTRLWQERPPRYSRALLETLALIAYRQPVTRGEIEEIRGVSVGTNIIRTLLEREWVRVVGHRDVPGRPAMYATTRQFLDYFNLKTLEDLPPLAVIRDLDSIYAELELPFSQAAGVEVGPGDADAAATSEQDQPESTPGPGDRRAGSSDLQRTPLPAGPLTVSTDTGDVEPAGNDGATPDDRVPAGERE